MLVANYRPRILLNRIARIKRSLSGSGKFKVSLGQEVTPAEVIGSGFVSSGFRTINLANLLSTDPKTAQKYLQRNIGQKIFKGELLAFKPAGIFGGKKVVTSPTDGTIDSFSDATGEIRISFLPRTVDLPAAVYGIVEQIDSVRNQVLIRTEVTIIYGVMGSGKVRDGILHLLDGRGDLVSSLKNISNITDHVLVGGSLIYKEAISQAVALGGRGIITGGMNAKDYRAMAGGRINFPLKMGSDVGTTIVATEGFGSIPIGEDVFQILSKYNDRFVILDGNRSKISLPTFDSGCIMRIRKTKLPELTASALVEATNDPEVVNLNVGQKIRLIAPPFMGEQGRVISVDKSPSILPSGISALMLTVETRTRKIKIPYLNVEVIN